MELVIGIFIALAYVLSYFFVKKINNPSQYGDGYRSYFASFIAICAAGGCYSGFRHGVSFLIVMAGLWFGQFYTLYVFSFSWEKIKIWIKLLKVICHISFWIFIFHVIPFLVIGKSEDLLITLVSFFIFILSGGLVYIRYIIQKDQHQKMETENIMPEKNTKKRPLFSQLFIILRFLIFIVILGVITYSSYCGYNYYYQKYLPKKLLEEAYMDVVNNIAEANDSMVIEYTKKIYSSETTWHYKDVSDYKLTEKLKKNNGIKLVRKVYSLARNNHLEAQCLLGLLYDPRGYTYSPVIPRKAAYWYNKAVEGGHAHSCHNLGTMYYYGIGGIRKDMVEAFHLFQLGALRGDEWSQWRLGNIYKDGIKKKIKQGYYSFKYIWILEPNMEMARYWWKKSAEQHNVNAINALEMLYDQD